MSLVWLVPERLAILHVGTQTCLWPPFSGRVAFETIMISGTQTLCYYVDARTARPITAIECRPGGAWDG